MNIRDPFACLPNPDLWKPYRWRHLDKFKYLTETEYQKLNANAKTWYEPIRAATSQEIELVAKKGPMWRYVGQPGLGYRRHIKDDLHQVAFKRIQRMYEPVPA